MKKKYGKKIAEVTKESEKVVHNAIKSVYSRVANVESSIQALSKIGIDATGKTADEVLGELSSKWGTLSKDSQTDVGIGVAGRYQLSRFISMMDQQ